MNPHGYILVEEDGRPIQKLVSWRPDVTSEEVKKLKKYLTVKEIAKTLNCSIAIVRDRLHPRKKRNHRP